MTEETEMKNICDFKQMYSVRIILLTVTLAIFKSMFSVRLKHQPQRISRPKLRHAKCLPISVKTIAVFLRIAHFICCLNETFSL